MAFHRTCDGVRRRDFLKVGALGLGGLSLNQYLSLSAHGAVREGARAKSAIFINLPGGPTHIDTFDLKPNSPSEYRGEFNPIPTNVPGIQICEHMPTLAQQMDKFVILRGVSHTLAAHQLGSEYVNTGNRPLPALEYPGYGAVVSKEKPTDSDIPPFVSIPNTSQRPGFLGVQYAPLHTGATPRPGQKFSVRGLDLKSGLTVSDVERRMNLRNQLDRSFADASGQNSLLDGLDRFSQQAYDMISSPRARQAFDVSQEAPSFSEPFGDSPFGQSCLLATRLIESGVRFVSVSTGGWDTHQDNWESLKTRLLPSFEQGLAALFNGLQQKGLLEQTVVLVTGEFGRTPKINQTRNGRDHYPRCMFMLMAGGGIQGGRVIGESDDKALGPKNDAITPDDVAASYYHALGIDHQKEYHTSTGRPIMIVRDGHVIPELFV